MKLISICFFSSLHFFICIKNLESYVDLLKLGEGNLFQNSPKEWYRYITKFLCLSLSNRESNHSNTKYLHLKLMKIYQSSNLFVRLSREAVKFTFTTRTGHHAQLHTSVSGSLYFCFPGYIENTPADCPYKDTPIAWVYQFEPHALFQINITFHFIFAEAGQLQIDTWNHLYYQTTNNKERYIYKKRYSTFSVLPRFTHVQVFTYLDTQTYGEYPYFFVKGVFSVLDKQILYNVPEHSGTLPANFIFGVTDVDRKIVIFANFVYHTKNNDRLPSYLVTVKKHQHICLKIKYYLIKRHIIYNGPGIFSKTLDSQQIQKTSAFQCLIHTSIKHSQKDYLSLRALKYILKPSAVSQNVEIHQNKSIPIHIPNKNCFDTICILNIQSQSGNQVNATVTKLISSEKAPNSSKNLPCIFSGLAAIEMFPHNSRESATHCKTHDSSHINRSFYSNNSSLILLAYWFEPYSVIDVTLIISISKCRLIQIDLCIYDKKCTQDLKSLSCQNYLDYVTNFVPVNISQDGDFIFAHMKDEQCVVLVLSSNTHDPLSHYIQIKLNKVQVVSVKFSIKRCASLTTLEDLSSKHYLSNRSLLAVVTCDLNDQNEHGALSTQFGLSQYFRLETTLQKLGCWTEMILRKPPVIYKKTISAYSTQHYFPPGIVFQHATCSVCCITPFLFWHVRRWKCR